MQSPSPKVAPLPPTRDDKRGGRFAPGGHERVLIQRHTPEIKRVLCTRGRKPLSSMTMSRIKIRSRPRGIPPNTGRIMILQRRIEKEWEGRERRMGAKATSRRTRLTQARRGVRRIPLSPFPVLIFIQNRRRDISRLTRPSKNIARPLADEIDTFRAPDRRVTHV